MKCDTWWEVNILLMSAPQLLRFGIESVLEESELKHDSRNELIIHKCVFRTALATPGLLNILSLACWFR